MSRLPGLPPEQPDDAQRELFDEIVRSRADGGSFSLFAADGALAGPFNLMVHDPSLGRHWSALGARLRFGSVLERRVVELVICTVGALYQAEFEFAAHAPLAQAAGVDSRVLEALTRGEIPQFAAPEDATAFEITSIALRGGRVDAVRYARALELIGRAGLVELASLVGYYAALAVGLNLFDADPPTGVERIWPDTI